MKRILLLVCFFIINLGFSQFEIEVEGAVGFQAYNDVRVPNEGGTKIDLTDDFSVRQPVIPFRARLIYTFNEKNHISALYAPLNIYYSGVSANDLFFESTQFMASDFINASYRFNSYRLTYQRDVWKTEKWYLGLGLTAKIRDAKIRLRNEEVSDQTTDLGFVPLIRFYFTYTKNQHQGILEGDGLFGPVGRAFDVFAGYQYKFNERFSGKIGYRFIEGGADVDQVYNFTWIHLATVGLNYKFN